MTSHAFQFRTRTPVVTHKDTVVAWVVRNTDRIIHNASHRIQTPEQVLPGMCEILFRTGEDSWDAIIRPRNDMILVEVVQAIKKCLERAGQSSCLMSNPMPKKLEEQLWSQAHPREDDDGDDTFESYLKLLGGS